MTSAPEASNLADLYHLPLLNWDNVRHVLSQYVTQAPGSGGPDRHTFWLSTVDGDGRPHLSGVGVMWLEEHLYFSGAPTSRKIRNIERDSRCALAVAAGNYDVTLEGRAQRVLDEAKLERLAELFAQGGWSPTVADGGFTNEFSAPSAGPPPWYVYEFTFERVYAVGTSDPGGATKWTFS